MPKINAASGLVKRASTVAKIQYSTGPTSGMIVIEKASTPISSG